MPSSPVSSRIVLSAVLLLAAGTAPFLVAQDAPLTKDQIRQFLLTAQIIRSKESDKGVTHPSRLTLSNGTITHDASFQPVDVHKSSMTLASGTTVINFVDSYKSNIAAYNLSELIGMDNMIPVYVERLWQGKLGSLSWWLPVKMDEQDRVAKKIEPPDSDAWNKQMYKVRVFDELIYDTDANLTNVLIGPEWQIWRIDFTRAFRPEKKLHAPNDLVQCDRRLLESLKALKADDVTAATKKYLTKDQVQALMVRRDLIVERFNQLIKEKGESAILY
ncbi:MAG TPA: hypothetical protein VMT75_00165 [Candidatus Saccharimonadales bacterium]|nr:hypothetical protein [Candidatus Saccharimonadales bacterium]